MRCLSLILLGALLCQLPAEARSYTRRATEHLTTQHSPAQSMVQALNSMSTLLNAIRSKAAADAAAPQLLTQYKKFRQLQTAAEGQPPMTEAAMNRHLSTMEQAMNDFRLACIRLVQEKFYGSAPLSKAVKKLAQDF